MTILILCHEPRAISSHAYACLCFQFTFAFACFTDITCSFFIHYFSCAGYFELFAYRRQPFLMLLIASVCKGYRLHCFTFTCVFPLVCALAFVLCAAVSPCPHAQAVHCVDERRSWRTSCVPVALGDSE